MTEDAAGPLAQHVCRTGYADLPASAVGSFAASCRSLTVGETGKDVSGARGYARGIALLWLRLPTLRYRGWGRDWGLSVATALLNYGWSLRQRGADSKHVALNVR